MRSLDQGSLLCCSVVILTNQIAVQRTTELNLLRESTCKALYSLMPSSSHILELYCSHILLFPMLCCVTVIMALWIVQSNRGRCPSHNALPADDDSSPCVGLNFLKLLGQDCGLKTIRPLNTGSKSYSI